MITEMRSLNQSAIREHALACSKMHRNGRFTRVGESFYEEVEADVEALVREIRNKYQVIYNAPLSTEEVFVTGALLEKIRGELNEAIARLIQNKVHRQPSVGQTLGRTR